MVEGYDSRFGCERSRVQIPVEPSIFRPYWQLCHVPLYCLSNQYVGVGGIMVSIAAFQAVDPGSIPGRRIVLVRSEMLNRPSCRDEVAEWLRRWTANPMGSARVGSNPILVEGFCFCFFNTATCRLFLDDSAQSKVTTQILAWQDRPPPWRNRLVRSAVNRKVGGSSPPGGAFLSPAKRVIGVQK